MNRREEKQMGSSRDFRKSTNLLFVFFRKYRERPPTATDRCCCTHRHLNITFQAISTDSSLVGYYSCTANASHQVCCCRRRVRCWRINGKIARVCTEVSLGEKQLLRGAGDLGLAQRLSGFSSDKTDNFIIINITVILRDTVGVIIIV